MNIYKYVLSKDGTTYADFLYPTYADALEAQGDDDYIVELKFSFDDSEIVSEPPRNDDNREDEEDA